MITAFPVPASKHTAERMLQMIVDHGHIDRDGVLKVALQDWQIDLLCVYGAPQADLEDSDDDEDEATVLNT